MMTTKKYLVHLILVIALGYVSMSFGIWWGVGPSAFLATLVVTGGNRRPYFLSGLIGGLLLWLIWSLVLTADGGAQITERIAGLFNLPSPLLLVVGGILGGLLGGLGALAGTFRLHT